MYYPDLKEFKKKAKKGNLIPVYKEIVADLDTPVSAYKKISEDASYSFLLESVEGGENIARYSFLGSNPYLIFKSKGRKVEIIKPGVRRKERIESDNPLDELKGILSRFKPVEVEGLPRFSGGAVGYLSYDLVRFFERLPGQNVDDLGLPDCWFLFTDTILIFDHLRHRIKVLSNALINKDVDEDYQRAVAKIDELVERLKRPLPAGKSKRREKKEKIKSNFTQDEFEKAVKKAKEYVRQGDVVQVVLSQRFSTPTQAEPFDIYRALRSINPSPYLYYLSFPQLKIVGSSPEVLVRREENKVETRPLAGTRPRGKTEKEDKRLKDELLKDKKERAEHVMLVDLGRNDLGRVCQYGTVKVVELMGIEKYSHVMHIVSEVKGKLKPGEDAFSVIKACFPAGTVSGAPKIRAMEIIDELEKSLRGPYAGAVGYFSFSGNMDTAITIRTIIIKDKMAYVQAGAGIVADSIPQREYKETKNKAKALLRAIEIAEEGME